MDRAALEPPVAYDVRLSALLGVAWRYKWLIAALAVCGALLLAARSIFAEKIYRAEALIAVADDEGAGGGGALEQVGALASLAGLALTSTQNRRAEYIALLTSKSVVSEVIEREGLVEELIPAVSKSGSGGEKKEAASPSLIKDAADVFLRDVLTVEENPRTGLIVVSVEWTDPAKAALLTSTVIAAVNARIRASAIEEATRMVDYLNRELEQTGILSVRDAIYRLLETNLSRIALANVREEYAFRIVDPAVAPNASHYVSPRPVLETAAGFLLGGILGFLLAACIERRRVFVPVTYGPRPPVLSG